MKSKLFGSLVFAFTVAAHTGFAEPPNLSVTKIVHRYMSPNIEPGSFAAEPKILYLSGTTYARLEEAPDPKKRIHGLFISAGPDIWVINLRKHRGRHLVDHGPTCVNHNNILELGTTGDLATLEFGKELDFFGSHGVKHLEPRVIDNVHCDASEFDQANCRVVLYTAQQTHKPYQLDVFRYGRFDFSVRYLSYETNLPFDPALFRPPHRIKMIEVDPTRTH